MILLYLISPLRSRERGRSANGFRWPYVARGPARVLPGFQLLLPNGSLTAELALDGLAYKKNQYHNPAIPSSSDPMLVSQA
jgi:hypothetical protein